MTAAPTGPFPDRVPSTDDEAVLLAWLHTMRDEHPVWQDRDGTWHVFRHADVLTVTRDTDTFSSDTARLTPAGAPVRRGMLHQLDPPEHGLLRRVAAAAFTPRAVAGLEPRIRAATRALLDVAGERFDLVDALAFPLPAIVIAELLGLPTQDHPRFLAWADGLFSRQVDDPTDPRVASTIAGVMGEISGYLVDQARARRVDPAGDLLSVLVAAEVDGRRLDHDQAASFAMLLLLAGHITTTVLLANAVRTFIEHPQTWDSLGADPALIPAAVEEVLRFRSPFTQASRATTRPVRLHGIEVPVDALVTVWLLSANRDPRAHLDPDRFDIRRGVGGRSQLAFGHGVHFCLGAPLARLEARVALEEITARWRALQIDHDSAPAGGPRPSPLAVRHLPVRALAHQRPSSWS